MKVWSEGAKQQFSANHPGAFYSGFPNTVLASAPIQLKDLRASNGVVDTFVVKTFTTPTVAIGANYFVGYDVSAYTWGSIPGDTVGLAVTLDGERHSDAIITSATDTILNVQNASQLSSGTWLDNYQGVGFYNDYVVFTLFKITYNPTGVSNVVKNNLTFFGNYPNPAVNSTNIKIGLKNTADVKVQILDMTGRVINTINQSKLGAGEHVIAVETANMAAGNYIYTITTSEGDRLGSQMSVVK